MCLETITTKIEKPLKKEMFAWQFFDRTKTGKLASAFYYYQVRIGVWQHATNIDALRTPWAFNRSEAKTVALKCYSYSPYNPVEIDQYPPGFHCMRTKMDAEDYATKCGMTGTVRRVKIRYVHTIGRQEGHDVLVARERFIIPLKGDQ